MKTIIDQPEMDEISFGQLRQNWRQQFAQRQIETAALDARLLLCAAAGLDQAQLISKERDLVPPEIVALMAQFGARRLAHEPVARILGRAEFYGLSFGVNKDTLVPRPETELLVDHAINLLPQGGNFIDLGTGTGCIAISILHERADISGVATDIATRALDMAAQNAASHGVEKRLALLAGSWFDPVPNGERFDLIVSNPPYIAQSERDLMNADALSFDPDAALFAEEEGMAAYIAILAVARTHLQPLGKLLFEIGFRQADQLEKAAKSAGATQVTFFKDLSGHNRVAQISW
ncbi:peptide chain release factor N(5)-glutamine methyltransferase [Maritalea sp. S77]|uniref:peptide chain release factor N(5)-glutamine methyltransferase n=1 Tax=Maritalea sp. S77 TaxID=3415125 RepID=UPI003C7CC0B3